MSKRTWIVAAVAASFAAGIAYAQYPIMNMVADKVIQKYQTSSCEQLWQEKAQKQGQPKPEMEQRAIQLLQQDPQMRQAFFAKVSAPIVNKMFECGMIP
jgi:transposase-like protein